MDLPGTINNRQRHSEFIVGSFKIYYYMIIMNLKADEVEHMMHEYQTVRECLIPWEIMSILAHIQEFNVSFIITMILEYH